jgi:hypothetical protein
MKNPGEVAMPNAVFEVEPQAQREHIQAVIGIQPDPRGKIPMEETIEFIKGVKQQSSEATEKLIATRVSSVYRYIQKTPEISEREDLTVGDVLQMGTLAIQEAAVHINTEIAQPIGRLHMDTVRQLGGLLTDARMIPLVGVDGQKVRGTANDHESRILDPVVLMEDDEELSEHASLTAEVSDAVMVKDIREKMLGRLSDRQKYVLARRFGLAGVPSLTLRELGEELGVTGERIRTIEESALTKIARQYLPLGYDRWQPKAGVEQFLARWLPDL